MKYLIFFDINGTLIERDARTDLPFEYAVNQLLNIENALKDVDTSARSDQDVFMEILEKRQLNYSHTLWQDFLELYKNQLEEFYPSDVWRDNVDAIEFVKWLSKTHHHLSLITGELSIGAEYKLKKIGLWKYFYKGGFGEDGLKRFDIASQAVAKCKNLSYDKILVIGDTMLDIETARYIGGEIVSITTGSHSREQLESLEPDYIIDSFSEIKNKFVASHVI